MDSFMRPSYLVNIGSEKFGSGNGSDLVSLRVIRSVGLPTDSCEVFLGRGKDYSFKKSDDVKVQLGYDDKLVPVFSGSVDNIEREVAAVRVTALGLAASLLRLRLNRVYLNQTAGKIVSNLAQEAKLKVKQLSEGITLPVYVVDDTANTYEHILRLAERCNFDAYMTDEEQLVFKEWDGGKSHSIQYGKELVRVEGLDFSPLYVSAKIYGESPSSFKGSDTFHWLTKQEVKGEAGTGMVLSIQDPAIKDKKTAETAAKATLDRLKCTFAAVIETVGKPEIKLGDTIALKDVPDSALQGNLEVRGIEHHLSKVKGFTSRISCWMRG
jgi:phage protein D